MKTNSPKQQAGVWLDSQLAVIITPESGSGDYSIQDKIKAQEYHGGKGEHGSNNADQANSLKYFKTVAALLLNFDEIHVFGPGKAQEEFLNFLSADAHFNSKKMTIDSADQMTEPQLIAKVRDFFKSN